jgi:hypothetical protein
MTNGTKRNDPFPNTSSTAETDWHKLIKTDDNPSSLFEERSELYPENLLKRIEALEKENENMKIVIALIFGIASRYRNKLAEPAAWAIIKNFIHDKGIPNMAFDLNKGDMNYRYIKEKDNACTQSDTNTNSPVPSPN